MSGYNRAPLVTAPVVVVMCQYLLTTGIVWTIAVGARVVALCRRLVRREVSSQPSPVAVVCELWQPPEWRR